jgi:hypothetical protein
MGSVPYEIPASRCRLNFPLCRAPLRSGSNYIYSGSTGAMTIVAVLALWIYNEDNAAVKPLISNALPSLILLHCNSIISKKKKFFLEIKI